MILLKNQDPNFIPGEFKDWNWLFHKDPDCILYAEDGHQFRIHKETLSQTETMRNILFDFKGRFFSGESRSPKVKGQKNPYLALFEIFNASF